MWAHEFDQKGIYVFRDSQQPSKLTVIAVKGPNEQCKDPSAYASSMTSESLSSVGIEAAPKDVQPNYQFVIASFAFIIGFNFLLVAGITWLAHDNAAKTKQGTGSIANIYYDKVAE